MALNAEYYEDGYSKLYTNAPGPFPGKMSVNQYSPNDIDRKVSKLLQKNLRQNRSFDSGRFRLSKFSDSSNIFIHVDDCSSETYAGVLYLSLPEHCKNKTGTLFYTNKISGKSNVDNENELKKLIQEKEFDNLSNWEVNLVSFNIFNRLIIYPVNKFHRIGELFGDTDENARLVQLFCWREIT